MCVWEWFFFAISFGRFFSFNVDVWRIAWFIFYGEQRIGFVLRGKSLNIQLIYKLKNTTIATKMPFFTKKSPTPFDNNNHKGSTTTNNANIISTASQLPMAHHIIEKKMPAPQIDASILKPQLVFHCQLAHGSPTGLISGFGSVKELYQKIAECYDFLVDEVRECIFPPKCYDTLHKYDKWTKPLATRGVLFMPFFLLLFFSLHFSFVTALLKNLCAKVDVKERRKLTVLFIIVNECMLIW